MSKGLTKTKDDVSPALKKLLERAKNASGAFARIYPLYQKLQTERFQTENASEGNKWDPLNAEYALYKRRRYGGAPRRASASRPAGNWNSYPGGGSKMLIGTGMLAGAVIGPGSPFEGASNHRAMFTSTSMTIAVEESGQNPDGDKFDYPQFVSERRPFMSFGRVSIEKMRAEISKFMIGK